MNSGFYDDLDTNFEQAYEMSTKNFSHTELIELLKNGNIPQKQIAAMKLEGVNEEEADILFDNLTGCDGKIREAVALKINQLLNQDEKYVNLLSPYYSPLADATIDINGNICRLAVDSARILRQDEPFTNGYLAKILVFIEEAFKGLDEIVFRDKKYTINKLLFKLYWCLDSLKYFTDKIPQEKLFYLLEKSSKISEYTIREKTAQILVNINNPKFNVLKEALINDENYYVREIFNKPCNIS